MTTRAAFTVSEARATALRALNYLPVVERMRASRATSVSQPLHSLLASIGASYGAVFTRLDCRAPYGVELLSQSDMFASEPEGRRIRLDSLPRPANHQLRRGQVLIAGAGTLGETELYGRSLIVDDRLAGKYVGPDAMVLEFLEPASDDALVAYAFLCSEIGVRALRSTSYGTKILRFRLDLLKHLPVPLVDESVKRRVGERIRTSMQLRERSAVLREEARHVVAGLPALEGWDRGTRARRNALMWDGPFPTLRAWTYASAGDAAAHLRRKWPARIADVVKPGGLFQGPRFTRVPCRAPHGIELYSQRDVFMTRRIPKRIARPDLPDAKLFVPADAIVVASDGQLTPGALFGKAEIASGSLSRAAVSQHLMRVYAEDGLAAAMYAYLSTGAGRALLQTAAVGTSIPTLRMDLVGSLPFPDFADQEIRNITQLVSEATDARDQADALEREAVAILEGEVIPAWLS